MPVTLARQTAGRLHAAAARDRDTMAQLAAELDQIHAWNALVYARARLAAERRAARAERRMTDDSGTGRRNSASLPARNDQ